MTKQVLFILGVFLFFVSMGNVMGQSTNNSNPPPPPPTGQGDANASNPNGYCEIITGIKLVQTISESSPLVTPVRVDLIIKSIKRDSEVLETRVQSIPNFSYTGIYSTSAYYHIESVDECTDGYSFYELTIYSTYEDGTITYSTTVIFDNTSFHPVNQLIDSGVTTEVNILQEVVAMPNPFRHNLSIQYDLFIEAENIQFEIINSEGDAILYLDEELNRMEGIHTINLNTTNWPNGNYYLRMTARNRGLTNTISKTLIKR